MQCEIGYPKFALIFPFFFPTKIAKLENSKPKTYVGCEKGGESNYSNQKFHQISFFYVKQNVKYIFVSFKKNNYMLQFCFSKVR